MPTPAAPYFLAEFRATLGRRLVDYEAPRIVLAVGVLDGCTDVLRERLCAGVRQLQVLVLGVLFNGHLGDVVWVIRPDVVQESDGLSLHRFRFFPRDYLGICQRPCTGIPRIDALSYSRLSCRNPKPRITRLA